MHRATTKQSRLLIDLRDVAVSAGALDVFTRRVQELRARYTNRPSFQERLAKGN